MIKKKKNFNDTWWQQKFSLVWALMKPPINPYFIYIQMYSLFPPCFFPPCQTFQAFQ